MRVSSTKATRTELELAAEERCADCEWPVSMCQCNTLDIRGDLNPYMSCAWCGTTTTREVTLRHVKNCPSNPNGCAHDHMGVDDEGNRFLLYCPHCNWSFLVPLWMRLNFLKSTPIP